MTNTNRQQREDSGSALEVVDGCADIGGEIAADGVLDMALDGLSAAGEIAGEVVGGVLSLID